MGKQKFGKKDIFAPVTKTGKEEEQKTEVFTETPVSPKRIRNKRKSKAKFAKESIPPETHRMIIHSFRMREDLVEGLREYAFFGKTKIYKVINQAVEEFLKKNRLKKHARSYESVNIC